MLILLYYDNVPFFVMIVIVLDMIFLSFAYWKRSLKKIMFQILQLISRLERLFIFIGSMMALADLVLFQSSISTLQDDVLVATTIYVFISFEGGFSC